MINSSSVLPIIVLYNPDFNLLNKLFFSLVGQTSDVCIIDNTPINIKDDVLSLLNDKAISYKYIALLENQGIAKAQNIGIEYAFKHGYKHVLLLDQDSSLPKNMIYDLCMAESKLLDRDIKVAAVGPAFRDVKTGRLAPAIQQDTLVSIHRNSIDTGKMRRSSLDPTFLLA